MKNILRVFREGDGGAPREPEEPPKTPHGQTPGDLEGRKEVIVNDPANPGRTITDIDEVKDGVLWEDKSAIFAGDNAKWVNKQIIKKLNSYLEARQHLPGYENAPIGIRMTEPNVHPSLRSAIETAIEPVPRRPSRCGCQTGVQRMSYIFEAGDTTVWSPALRVGSLFVSLAECLANWEGVPSGLSAMASDYYEIDVEAFGALVRALLNDSSAGHAIFGQVLHGFVATCLVMLERAGAALPETGRSEEIGRLTSQAAANMPV